MSGSYGNFSFTAVWAKIGGLADGILAGSGKKPEQPVSELPESRRPGLAEKLAPHAAELERLRRETLARVDRRARIRVPLLGAGALVVVMLFGGGVGAGLFFGLFGALGGWFFSVGRDAEAYRRAVKSRFGEAVAEDISGFTYEAERKADLEEMRAWKIFPDVRGAKIEDHMTGERDGRRLSLSRVSIVYDRRRGKSSFDPSLYCFRVDFGTASEFSGTTVVVGKEESLRFGRAAEKTHGLVPAATGSAEFDEKYRVYATDKGTAERDLILSVRSAFPALEKVCAAVGPILIFMPKRMTVLFPLESFDFAFEPKPFWIPLDTDRTLAAFASDLAIRERYLNAALALPVR